MTRTLVCLAAAVGMLTLSGCGDVKGGGAAVATNTAVLKPLPPAPEDKDLVITPPPLAPSASVTGALPPGAAAPGALPTESSSAAAGSTPTAPIADNHLQTTEVTPVPAANKAATPATSASTDSSPLKNAADDQLQGFGGGAATTTPAAPQTVPGAQPNDHGPHVTLSDAEVLRTNREKIHVVVKYVFSQGKPTPTNWYTVDVFDTESQRGEIKLEGTAVQQSGKIEDDLAIGGRSANFAIRMWEGPSQKDKGHEISTVRMVEVRRDLRPDESDATLRPAGVGVGVQGKDYGAGMVTTPVSTYFAAKELIVFTISIPHEMNLFKGLNNRNPNSQEEFMENIIKKANIVLPELPPGERYVYDPQTGELMVEHPKK